MPSIERYPVTNRNKARRLHKRASYDVEKVHAMLDAAMFCHLAYVVDGQPYCTPTIFWRRGNDVIWHGSAVSRMLKQQVKHVDVCLTVTFLDSLVLTRSAFQHSVNYRSVMLFGRASHIDDLEEKRLAANELLDTFYPGRSALVSPPTALELKQVSFLKMPIDEASAKIRDLPTSHEPAEYRGVPVWAGEIPIEMRVGDPVPCSTLDQKIAKGPDIADYREGARLDTTLLKIRRESSRKP